MEDELLQELDSILKPAINKAWSSAKRQNEHTDPKNAFLENFKVEIDHTKVALSKNLNKLDLMMNNCSTLVEQEEAFFSSITSTEEEFPDVNPNDYVQEIADGFKVWDGIVWRQVSKQANIKVDVFQNPENNRPAVRVWALDDTTKTSVLFVDKDIYSLGWDLSLTTTGDNFAEGYDSLQQINPYWEDPFYLVAKNIRGVGSITAGALAMNHMANLTPWKNGIEGIKDAKGWYRNSRGVRQPLSGQRASGAGGHQVGARNAIKRAKVFKNAGRVCLWIGVGMSIYEGIDAVNKDYSNKEEVITKASVDITIMLIGAYGGPVGWFIAGSYFILNVSGAFGDWGTPSGISQTAYNQHLRKELQYTLGERIESLRFEVDYIPPVEQVQQEFYLEERIKKQDRIPKVIFNTEY